MMGPIETRRIFAFEAVPGDVLLEILGHPDPPTVHRGPDGRIAIAYKQIVATELGHWDEPERGEDTPDPHPNADLGVPVAEVIIRTLGHENGERAHEETCPWRVRAMHVIEVCDSRSLEPLWLGEGRAFAPAPPDASSAGGGASSGSVP